MAQDLRPGDRVKVTVSTEKRDPWLTPKQGWEGIAVGPALNMENTHWQIKFVEPWCSLGMTRIMPVDSLQVLGRTMDEEMAIEEKPEDIHVEEVAPTSEQDSAQDDGIEEEFEQESSDEITEEEAPEAELLPEDELEKVEKNSSSKGKDFVVGDVVRVRNKAGANSAEEHIIRRQGHIGRVIRLCEVATSCVDVDFEDGKLPVMMPKAFLLPVTQGQEHEKKIDCDEVKTPRAIKVKAQMRLPF